MDEIGGKASRFSVKTFCFTVPKLFVAEPFSELLIAGKRKVCGEERGGGVGIASFTIFCQKHLSHRAESFCR